MTAHPLDIRMAHLEGAYEQISDRLNGFDTRFATIESKIDATRDSLDSKIDDLRNSLLSEMNRRFERVDGQFASVDDQFKRVDDQFKRVDDQFKRVDDQFAEMRKLIINGCFAIGAFVIISILLPLVQRFH